MIYALLATLGENHYFNNDNIHLFMNKYAINMTMYNHAPFPLFGLYYEANFI